MLETSARLLRLLSLLQSRTEWGGPELADRLEVSPRTVRYDVDKLRNLGYPVHAVSGVAGGYRLGAGAKLPPLLLDDEEAVAVAVSLRTAAGGSVAGIEESSVRALAKLEQVLPSRLRHQVSALHSFTTHIGSGARTTVPGDLLVALAGACRDLRRVRFDYRTHDGSEAEREVEPYRLAHTGRRWYLVGWDLAREGWRTFRLDRLTLRTPYGARFTPRPAPPDDLVPRGVDTALMRYRAAVTVRAPAAAITARVPGSVLVEAVDEETCVVHAGADTPYKLALYVLGLDAPFSVDGPPELLDALATMGARLAAAPGPLAPGGQEDHRDAQ
ncbi:helix-turn-helix transcriptional regulator [Nonomuraea sp. NPDC050556]|uniref:helix-turn-helix transcriptional regulator n=1 Tax=Nonomuraea sp. NPDC050556 TaxID=3364369 RepID=UPI0037BDDB22